MARIEETKILVMAQDKNNKKLIRDVLIEQGYSVCSCGLVRHGRILKANNFGIVVFELNNLAKGSLCLIKEIKAANPESLIIAIVNSPSFESVRQVLKLGIYDYLVNPFSLEELLFIVRNAARFVNLVFSNKKLLDELGQRRAVLEKHTATLEKEGSERVRLIDKLYKDLQDTYMRTIKALIQAIDARDHYTHSHSKNVSRYAAAIAKELKLSQKEIEEIKEACELHDLGKIAIQDYILTKPGKLTKAEWRQMKTHSLKSAQILSPLAFLDGAIDLIRQHHERYDGKGYPDGRKGENIPLGARIMAVADSYDAMISHRPYKKRPLTKKEAILELKKNRGTQFDPKIVSAFLRIIHQV